MQVYLDNNATTQIDERVFIEMLPFFKQHYGNPSSKYYPQAEIAKKAVESSRLRCANLMYRNFNPVGAIHELPLQVNRKVDEGLI